MSTLDIQRYLDERHVDYSLISHPAAYTAMETAEAAHIPGRELAKIVVVKVDGKPAMVVQPATSHVNFRHLKSATGSAEVSLANETEMEAWFPDCETGAMPPFGSFYNMDTYVDRDLTEDEEIAFNAGSHTELIRIAYRDYERLEHPRVISL